MMIDDISYPYDSLKLLATIWAPSKCSHHHKQDARDKVRAQEYGMMNNKTSIFAALYRLSVGIINFLNAP